MEDELCWLLAELCLLLEDTIDELLVKLEEASLEEELMEELEASLEELSIDESSFEDVVSSFEEDNDVSVDWLLEPCDWLLLNASHAASEQIIADRNKIRVNLLFIRQSSFGLVEYFNNVYWKIK